MLFGHARIAHLYSQFAGPWLIVSNSIRRLRRVIAKRAVAAPSVFPVRMNEAVLRHDGLITWPHLQAHGIRDFLLNILPFMLWHRLTNQIRVARMRDAI